MALSIYNPLRGAGGTQITRRCGSPIYSLFGIYEYILGFR
jgi:hypothetical protein